MKKIMALLLSVLMLVSVAGVTAGAAGDYPFTDVPEDHPAREAIQYLYELDLMKGVGDGIFAPGAYYTRAMFVTMLGRMEGIDTAQYPGSAFQDVDPKSPSLGWAAPYINWAAENEIVKGIGSGKFSPNGIITEEQYCAIVCRYLDFKGVDFPGAPIWKPEIADMDEVNTWAKASVVNMVYYNLVDLTYDFQFWPQNTMDRATIARYFTDLHIMLSQDVCPEIVYDPAELLILESKDIISILRGGASYIGNWFYFNSYCDSSDIISAPNPYLHNEDGNWTYERVVNPYIYSIDQVKEQGYRYYMADISQGMTEEKQFIEQGSDLYLSKPDGLGGFMIDRAHIDADIMDASYVLTISYFSGDELMYTQETSLHYDGARWVLGDPVDVCLMYADMDVAWG